MNGQNLKELRLKLKLTQEKMGEKLGISRDAVSKLESGKNTMSKPVKILLTHLESSFCETQSLQ